MSCSFRMRRACNRKLFDVFLIYLISGDRPIVELLSPRAVPLPEVFGREFSGMTLISVTPEDLDRARQKLVNDLHAMFTDVDKEFLLSVKQGQPKWNLFAHPHAERLPAVQWKLQNIVQMAPERRRAAIARLEAVLEGRDH